jgi:hypothetical protein
MMENSDTSAELQDNSSKTKKGKKLIPWRDPVKGPILKTAMFKLALTSSLSTEEKEIQQNNKIYFKFPGETRKIDERWEQFAAALFTQPEFDGLEGSWRLVRDMFNETKNERAKHHGWMDANGGVTGNLSNHAGDLTTLDQTIKDCLMDFEQLTAEKELKKDLGPELNEKENNLIQTQLSKESKSKRKDITLKYKIKGGTPDSGGSSSDTSASSRPLGRKSTDERILDFLFNDGAVASKKQRVGGEGSSAETSVSNAQREKDLMRKLNLFSNVVDQIVDDAFLDRSCIQLLTNVTVEYMVNVFCCYGEGFDLNPKDFKSEMESYGLSKLDAGKLFMFLRNVSVKPVEEWEAQHRLSLDDLIASY